MQFKLSCLSLIKLPNLRETNVLVNNLCVTDKCHEFIFSEWTERENQSLNDVQVPTCNFLKMSWLVVRNFRRRSLLSGDVTSQWSLVSCTIDFIKKKHKVLQNQFLTSNFNWNQKLDCYVSIVWIYFKLFDFVWSGRIKTTRFIHQVNINERIRLWRGDKIPNNFLRGQLPKKNNELH
jgi:hypothetical protein